MSVKQRLYLSIRYFAADQHSSTVPTLHAWGCTLAAAATATATAASFCRWHFTFFPNFPPDLFTIFIITKVVAHLFMCKFREILQKGEALKQALVVLGVETRPQKHKAQPMLSKRQGEKLCAGKGQHSHEASLTWA